MSQPNPSPLGPGGRNVQAPGRPPIPNPGAENQIPGHNPIGMFGGAAGVAFGGAAPGFGGPVQAFGGPAPGFGRDLGGPAAGVGGEFGWPAPGLGGPAPGLPGASRWPISAVRGTAAKADEPAPLDRLSDSARRMMQYLTDYFDFYWQGRTPLWKEQDSLGLRAPVYRQIRVPRTRRLPRHEDEQPSGDLISFNRPRGIFMGRRQREKYDKFKQEIESGMYGVVNYTRPLGLELEKVLGRGGQGMACLFRMTNPDGSEQKIVVKACTSTTRQDLAWEMYHMSMMSGANHIVQRLYARNLPVVQNSSNPFVATGDVTISGYSQTDMDSEGSNDKRKADDSLERATKKLRLEDDLAETAKDLDSAKTIYIMEYMRQGDVLFSLVRKANDRGVTFKDQDLWDIFHCLFRGVVGMAYVGHWRQGKDPEKEDIVQQYEELPRDPVSGGVYLDNGLIHFDLDTQNSMMGDFDERHQRVPIVKIGDLGLAEHISPEKRNDMKWMMAHRKSGKYHIYTPEQNTKDWDYLDISPAASGEPTAGNYRWWTNLYQIGHIMWQLITGFTPDEPPQCSRERHLPWRGEQNEYWTYGGLIRAPIQAARFHDPQLTQVVAWCMAVRPEDRPTMEELDEIFLHKTDPDSWVGGEFGSFMKVGIRDLLDEPLPPPRSNVPQFSGAAAAPAPPEESGEESGEDSGEESSQEPSEPQNESSSEGNYSDNSIL